ncbi:MAG: MFS transporter, partial [Bacteroidetes bacterium]|nr:MFS transporter [Bacteroidota bacterium]
MKKKSSVYLIAISFVASIGGFLFGYDTAIISGCNSFLESHFQLTSAMLGWVVSSALLGTILGCVVSGTITDRFGRKKALITSASLLSISAIGSMLTPEFLGNSESLLWMQSDANFAFNFLIIIRLIGGIGVGITSVVAPVYISELTLPQNRG